MSGSHTEVEARLQAIADAAARSRGVDLIELGYHRSGRRQVVRIFVDKVGGVTIDECAEVSRRISADLDAADVLEGRYTLEVSSPGIDRPLKSAADFRRKVGREASVRYGADSDKPATVEGMIGEVGDDFVMIGNTKLAITEVIEGKLVV